MHLSAQGALCVGLQHGLPVGYLACWTICRLAYPLEPSYADDPGHIPCLLLSCPISYFQLPSYPLLWPDSGCTIMERGSYG